MTRPSNFAHVGGTLNNIDQLPGLRGDTSRPDLENWSAAEREAAKMGPARRGAEHGDDLSGLDSMPTTALGRRRRRRSWESPASFEHHDAYDLTPDASMGASSRSGRQHRVICSFRISEGNKAIRQALMSCICTCGETYEWIRRLGLPTNSLKNKLPYHRYLTLKRLPILSHVPMKNCTTNLPCRPCIPDCKMHGTASLHKIVFRCMYSSSTACVGHHTLHV